jgi:hypothetical protein
VLGISEETRKHINKIFDFKNDVIKPDGLNEDWQTSGTIKICILALNLWNGYVDEEGICTTPEYLFACDYAKYFIEGVKLRYPHCFREIFG